MRRSRPFASVFRGSGSDRPSSWLSPGWWASTDSGLSHRRRRKPGSAAAGTRRAGTAQAIAHHYDGSNRFYELVLRPSMTYSCAVWPRTDATLEEAQAAKYELICRKLDLGEGMRLLDVGFGWGGMTMHAAKHHGASVVGVTLYRRQVEWAQKSVADAGLADRVEIRPQDYRDVIDGPFDAISSIDMFEHVGLPNWDEAVAEVGAGRARVWRLYMAASALNFEAGRTQVHQALAVRADRGRSGVPLRPTF